jgi:hypothetical protein
MKNKNQKYCECCGQPIIDYKVTFTKRNLVWLYALGWIGKHKYANEGYWVNYKEVHELVAKHFGKTVNGKWKPMELSAYGRMGENPWNLIESNNSTKEKFRANGDWRLTSDGIKLINNQIQILEIVKFKFDGYYETSRLIYAKEVKQINFAELTDLFNSF